MFKLICFDMDGVIFKDVNFWIKLHEKFGTLEKGTELTEKYLHTDYDKLVEEVVVKLWKGKDAKLYYDLVNSIEYLPGVKETFEKINNKGLITAIITGSSIDVARRVQKDFIVDHLFANELVIKDDKVSGEFLGPIGAGKEKKAEIIKHLCEELGINLDEVIYIGDHDVDIEAFKIVGKAIAFNSESKELKNIAHHVVDSNNLGDILKWIP